MISIANQIRIIAQKADYEELKIQYKKELEIISSMAKAYAINRDGDLYQISCPVCKNKKVAPASSGFFVCSKKHVFSVYTEDGVTELKEDSKIMGPDYIKGEDAHGHDPYIIFKPDDKSPVYLATWPGTEKYPKGMTIQDISNEVWALKTRLEPIGHIYFNYYVEIDTMRAGEQIAQIGSQIKTWPEYLNNMRWFLILSLLKDTDWRLQTIHPGER